MTLYLIKLYQIICFPLNYDIVVNIFNDLPILTGEILIIRKHFFSLMKFII